MLHENDVMNVERLCSIIKGEDWELDLNGGTGREGVTPLVIPYFNLWGGEYADENLSKLLPIISQYESLETLQQYIMGMIDFKCMKTVRTMLDQCHVYSNPSALMNIHFQDKKDWDRAKTILWERNVNMHC